MSDGVSPQRRPQDRGTHSEPLWFLRINPLLRSRLSDSTLRRLLAELAEIEHVLGTLADLCSQELYELIGATEDEEHRGHLIQLRRAIHNDRAPRTPLEPAPTPNVARWLAAHQHRRDLRAEAARSYPEAAGRERIRLATLLSDEDLRRALALVAPEVHRESDRYRNAVAGTEPIPARVRKSERGLIQYVARAMARTSPLSRFTAVGLAVPDADGVGPGEVEFDAAVAFPGLDRAMLGYVLGGLRLPEGDALLDIWMGLSPTSKVDSAAGRLFFLRPTDTGIQRMAVPLSPSLRLLLEATSMGPRRMRAVTEHLASGLGCPIAQAQKITQEAVRQGLFCSFSEEEDGAADLGALLDRAEPPASALLEEVAEMLPRLRSGHAAERGADVARARTALAEVSRMAGRPAQIMVEEDYVVPPLTVCADSWRAPLADLGATVELLSVFDWMHEVRVLMADAFVQRFGAGAGVPLVEHAQGLLDEVADRAVALDRVYREGADVPVGTLSPDGCLEQLLTLRRELTAEFHTRLTKAAGEGQGSVALTAGEVTELTAALPERFRRDPLTYGVLVQQHGDRLVFNDGLPGHGMLYARFLDADRQLGGKALPYLAQRLTQRYGHDGCRVVEDLGLHQLNVNAHPQVLPHGLRAEDWFALRLVHDTDTGMLGITDAEGRRMRVLPLGAGHPGLFPAPLSIASALVMSGRLYNRMPDTWHATAPWDGETVRMCPRMTVGEVVIARRRWYGGHEWDAVVAAGPEEDDRLLALTAWRGRHGVPEEVFLKTAPEDEGLLGSGEPDLREQRLKWKPQYADLASALSTRVLPRMMDRRTADGGGTVYLEEALPGVVDGTRATEWVVEIGRDPGGRFQYGVGTR